MSIVLILLMVAWYDGAEEGTRTPTPLRVRGPEPRASANSATSAQKTYLDALARQAATLSLANAATRVKFAAARSQRRFRASNSSSVRGQSDPKRRERLRSASTLPLVWQRAQ